LFRIFCRPVVRYKCLSVYMSGFHLSHWISWTIVRIIILRVVAGSSYMYKAQNFYREQSFVSCKPAAGHVHTHHTNLGLYSRFRKIDKLEEYSVLVSGATGLRDGVWRKAGSRKWTRNSCIARYSWARCPRLGPLCKYNHINNVRLGRPSTQQVKFEIT
jgi:hypothetical protein